MSKLFKLKEWVTIPEAARYLSQILNEPVAESDVLQLALDKHIKISVDFPNRAKARMGRVIPFKDVPMRELPSLRDGEILRYPDGYPLRDIASGDSLTEETPFIHFDKDVVSINGLWDLALQGCERLDIEHDLQQLIGGPEVTLINLEGTFLNRRDGTWAALQDRFEDRTVEDVNGTKRKIKGSYFPAGGLGTDCTRVIRTSEIVEFQARLEGTTTETPLSTKERNTLLTIIAVLCNECKLDYSKHAKTAGLIQGAAQFMKISIGETTIENHLKKIPDALGTRTR